MRYRLSVLVAAVAFVGAVGCHSHSSSSTSSTPAAPSQFQAGSLVIIPQSSPAAELIKPSVNVKSNSVTIDGSVRIRNGKINPNAVMQILVVDRHGNAAGEYSATLTESETLGTLTYHVNFAPLPAKGSVLTIEYQDWQPSENYTSSNLAAGSGTGNGSSVKTGSGGSSGKSSGRSYGGSTHGPK